MQQYPQADFHARSTGERLPVNVKLDLRTELDFKRVIQDLQSSNLDLGIAWGGSHRCKHYPGIRFEYSGPDFDLVVISHSTQELEALFRSGLEIDWDEFANKRVIMLRPGSQPLLELFPQPSFDNNGQQIQVGTIDGVIAVGSEPAPMYATTLRTRYEGRRRLMDNWYDPLAIGQPLPTLPIWLKETWAIALELESSYEETCRTLRIR